MRASIALLCACLAAASPARAQRFEFTHRALPAENVLTQDVALGDVDGDGDLDAFVGKSNYSTGAEQNRLLLNGGTGVFADATATNLPALLVQTQAVALGDVDGDGDLDAFVATFAQNRLDLNDGTGVFTDATATNLPALSDTTVAVALGDVDGDGDFDAFAANNGQENQLYANLTRQLAWRGVPRIGMPLTLDLWGPANGPWLLAASAGTANIPLPPFGTLRLDPLTLFIVAGGPLDPQGVASLTFPIPANPALVGLSLDWQAVVGPPLRFTNLEVTTVTDLRSHLGGRAPAGYDPGTRLARSARSRPCAGSVPGGPDRKNAGTREGRPATPRR